MAPKIQKATPPYVQIADYYRERISTGSMRHGDRLPTVVQIAEQWGCSQGTAHKALRTLRGEGLIDTRQQGSTVIGHRAVPTPAERVQRLEAPEGDEVEVNEVGIATMLPSVGAALGIDSDAMNRRVVRRQSISYRDGQPYRLAVMWVPVPFTHDIPELLEDTHIPNVVALIAQRTGREADAGRDYFEGRAADEREANALAIEPGTPVLAGTAVWRDEAGPVAYLEFVCPPHHSVSNDYRIAPMS